MKSFYSKKSTNNLYLLEKNAIFVTSLNKNNYYHVMIHFVRIDSINNALKEIKAHLNNSNLLIYLRNENVQKIYESVESDLINRKMNFLSLKQSVSIKNIEIDSKYSIQKTKINEALSDFFIDCFRNEWDENVEKWFIDFNEYKGTKEVLIIKAANKISSAVLYWVNDNNIYIFLLGTSLNYRQQGLAQFLLKTIQKEYPNLNIDLTVNSDTGAAKFYNKLGFVKTGISGICI